MNNDGPTVPVRSNVSWVVGGFGCSEGKLSQAAAKLIDQQVIHACRKKVIILFSLQLFVRVILVLGDHVVAGYNRQVHLLTTGCHLSTLVVGLSRGHFDWIHDCKYEKLTLIYSVITSEPHYSYSSKTHTFWSID